MFVMEKRMSNQQEGIDKHPICQFFSRRRRQDIMQWYKNKWKQGKNKKHRFERILKQVQKNVGCYMQEKADGSVE